MERRRLTFAIHDLNSWGGHDRSTLEIARRLSHKFPVNVISYTLDDPMGLESWGDMRFHQIRPHFRRPAMIKLSLFYLATALRLGVLPKLHLAEPTLVHATGACSLVSDVVQVQFVNTAWKRMRDIASQDVYQAPHARLPGWARRMLIGAYHDLMLRYDLAVERFSYRPHKSYIAIANGVAKELKEYFGLTEHVHVIHHGVDSKVFCPSDESNRVERELIRNRLGFGPEDLVVAFVGAFERKGLAVAIDAIGLMDNDLRKNIKLMAVGTGSVDGFKLRAMKLGVEDRVVFAGHTREVAPLYRAADAFLLPTLYEPFGLVILEAMASALPVVVSRLAGGAELIVDGESGLCLDNPADPKEVAGALSRLLKDPEMRKSLAHQARAVAENRTWDKVADEYAAVLGPLLKRGAK